MQQESDAVVAEVECHNSWILCLCVACFDVELGQSNEKYIQITRILEIESIYPSAFQSIFSKAQLNDVYDYCNIFIHIFFRAYSAFPDSNAKTEYRSTFCFRFVDYQIDFSMKILFLTASFRKQGQVLFIRACIFCTAKRCLHTPWLLAKEHCARFSLPIRKLVSKHDWHYWECLFCKQVDTICQHCTASYARR